MDFSTLLIVTCAVAFYFLPSIVGRDKGNVNAIFLLNLLLGWSVIGWIVALVWATTNDPAPVPRPKPVAQPRKSIVEELERLQQMKESGHLNDSEFELAKSAVYTAHGRA